MLQMNKNVTSKSTLGSIAGALIPLSIVIALAVSLVIGLVVVISDFIDFQRTDLPVTVSGISSRAPGMSEMFVREPSSSCDVVYYCGDAKDE